MAGASVTKYLIRVNVSFDLFGVAQYAYTTAPNDSAVSQTVDSGDQVAWFVQVLPTPRPQVQPPYRIDFQDHSFFGTSSLVVPEGGYSPYLPVRTIKGHTKYTVTVQGVSPPSDPEMQTGNYPLKHPLVALAPPRQIVITWDGTAGTYPALTINGQAQPRPFPFTLHPLGTSNNADIVTFATSAGQGFDLLMGAAYPNSNVLSPWNGSNVIDASSGTAGPFTVDIDAGGYKYANVQFGLKDGTTTSHIFELDVAAWPPSGRKKSADKPK